jgi:NTE family protein
VTPIPDCLSSDKSAGRNNTRTWCPHFRRLWHRPTILRRDPGLAASPRVRYMLKVAGRYLLALCFESFSGTGDPGGDTHERSIRSGCSPAVHDRATEVVATGSAHRHSRKATPMNTTPFSTEHFTSAAASDRPRPDQDHPQVDAMGRAPAAGGRALVLGGGGSAGNAWLIGVIAGLSDAGLDATEADLIIGTSAGSTAAAQITSATPAELLAQILAAAPRQRTGPAGSDGGRVPNRSATDHMERTSRIFGAAEDAADLRRRMGAAALDMDAESDGSRQTRWRATVATRLPSQHWPERTVLITAVDARAGEPVVFDRQSGVDLADAVAASCSSGPPYRIDDNRFIDGAYRRNENADLAAGYGRVLVLSPLGGRTRAPLGWGMHLGAQVDELRASGSRVETILPDSNSLNAFGTNLMDLSARPPAARAGYDQGRALAEQLTEFWSN